MRKSKVYKDPLYSDYNNREWVALVYYDDADAGAILCFRTWDQAMDYANDWVRPVE